MTNTMDTIELDEMRNQIAILKKKLSEQEIVSDRLLRDTMKNKIKTLNNLENRSLACAILSFLLYLPMHYITNLSWAFCIATCLMMLFCFAATLYIYHPINKTDLMSADMTTVAQIMARFRRQNTFWIRYVTPTLIIPWLLWACYDYAQTQGIELFSRLGAVLVLPLIIGAIIGGIIGFSWHRKAQSTALDIIKQIEE